VLAGGRGSVAISVLVVDDTTARTGGVTAAAGGV
jgi:hypothetical protein